MRISILLPTKNAAPYLAQCLDSIRTQTIEDWELIAINDHSDDNSLAILNDYVSQDNRIRCINNLGTGIISALQTAYQHATGTYITRMDADDIMTPNKLEQLLDQVKQNGKGTLAVGLVKYFSESTLGDGYKSYESWLNHLSSTRSNFLEIYKECSIPSPAWMLHRDDLDRCGAFDSDVYPEDYDLAFRMRAEGFKVCPTTEVVHLWRDHPVRSSRTDDNYADNRFIELKVSHFVTYDFDPTLKLILWGAGKKGKSIARLLLEKNISFKWITNNTNKIGREIYGVALLRDDSMGLNDSQIIIAVAQPEEQIKISEVLSTHNKRIGVDTFYFC